MKRLVALAIALMMSLAVPATATEVTLMWEQPTLDCEGNSIAGMVFGGVEVYVSDRPIPTSGEPRSNPPEAPPSGFSAIEVDGDLTELTIDLAPGTYYFRVRIQGDTGEWSNLSNEAVHTVGPMQITPPVVIIIG